MVDPRVSLTKTTSISAPMEEALARSLFSPVVLFIASYRRFSFMTIQNLSVYQVKCAGRGRLRNG